MSRILVTGSAGFIGFHLVSALIGAGHQVVGLDNINDYYDVGLKLGRLREAGIEAEDLVAGGAPVQGQVQEVASARYAGYRFVYMDLVDGKGIKELFAREGFDCVVHLAAQAGVRYSLTNPQAYADANITGFLNILEACRAHTVQHLVYASSSSVYGKNTRMPFSVSDNVDHPVSLYAASKKANELMAHTYSHLFGIPATGLRFFTVYGPWGRPDMALFLFTRAILAGRPIEVFNQGEMLRDFTYIDDIVNGILSLVQKPAAPWAGWSSDTPDPSASDVPHRVYNIGNGSPVKLMDFIGALEKELGKTAEKIMLPIQPGDVPATWADTSALERDTGYKPGTPVSEGIARFVAWYRRYYNIN